MANDIDRDDKAPALAGKTTNTDSPEDIVRRLLESEAGDSRPAQPTLREEVSPQMSEPRPELKKSVISRESEAAKRKLREIASRVRSAVLSYRPTPRHLALLLLSVIFLIMPWLIPVLFLLSLVLLIISYLSIGHDRSGELFAAWFRGLTQRNPDKAEVLRARAERVSARASGLMRYLPERWTAGLYLPDFIRADEPSGKLASDPFERLSKDTT